MKTFIRSILPVLLVILITFFSTENICAQTDQKGTATDTSHNMVANGSGSSTVPRGITPGRARALAGTVLGLISLIIGWRAKSRSGRSTGSRPSGAITALILGLISIILSVVHLATTTGGFGTGGGKAGAIVGLLLGLVGMILGGLAYRSQRG